MYAPLKRALWDLVDSAVQASRGAVPTKRTSAWRLYEVRSKATEPNLIAVHYSDVAGGRFSFYSGCSSGPEPALGDLDTGVSERPFAQLDIELDWQSPPAHLVRTALSLSHAQPILSALGVTENQRHHLLSFEVLESLGVDVARADWESVVVRARKALNNLFGDGST